MSIEEHKFSPSEVTEVTGVKPELMRNWRTRGYLNEFGLETENGHWRYSVLEVVAIWMAERIGARNRKQSHKSLNTFKFYARTVTLFIVQEAKGFDFSEEKIVAYVERTETDEHGWHCLNGYEIVTASSLSELEDYDFDLLEIINLLRLAQTAPEAIKLLVLEDSKNDDLARSKDLAQQP